MPTDPHFPDSPPAHDAGVGRFAAGSDQPARAEVWAQLLAALASRPGKEDAIAIAKAADELMTEYDKRFPETGNTSADDPQDAENPTAAPFEAHIEGGAVKYEADDPTPRDPDDPNEPFSGRTMQ